jgi:hypothetical protein
MLGQDIPVACFFVDSPSGGELSVRLDSKQVNFSESRVEIWNSDLGRIPCPKNRCRARSSKRLLARFVNGRAGFRYSIKGDVNEHEIATPCSREAVPVWEGNATYAMPFVVWEERFECDGRVLRSPLRKPVGELARVTAVGAAGIGIFALWIWEIMRKDRRERILVKEEGGKRLRGKVKFEAVVDVA